MTAASTIDDRTDQRTRKTGRRTNPLQPDPNTTPSTHRRVSRLACPAVPAPSKAARPAPSPGAARRRDQLPAFAPLLEELEIAGWTSHRHTLGGNFHDWMLLGADRLLVAVGHAVGPEPLDPTVAALVAQSAWTAIRAHARHAEDAGSLLTLTAQTLWPTPVTATRAAAAVALVDLAGGQASVALAGDCLAWRVRAATSEPLAIRQPVLGATADFTYLSHSLELTLRERLILAADNCLDRSPKLAHAIAAGFSRLDAETHRRMTAAEAVALLRRHYEQAVVAEHADSASVAAIRRR